MTRRLGAVGTIIRDRIQHPDAPPVERWGGAVYSLAALSAACPAGWTVRPIMKVGEDAWEPAVGIVGAMPHVELGQAVQRVPERNDRVTLRYRDAASRRETLTGGVPPWGTAELLQAIRPLSALYVNFISGVEIGLETARVLRREFDGFIYADLHSLFLAPPGDGPREPRALPDAGAWLGCFDAVQMNEHELALLGVGVADLGDLLASGPSLAVVTRGAAGAAFARSARDEGRLRAETGAVATPAGRLEGDPTGCGDVWGATLCASMVGGLPLVPAIDRAHRAAAAKIGDPRVERLRDTLAASDPRREVLP